MMRKPKKEHRVKSNSSIHSEQKEIPVDPEEHLETLGQTGAESSPEEKTGNGKSELRDSRQDDQKEDTPIQPGEAGAETLANLEEQNLRLRAEFANYKRRVEKEKEEFALYIKAELFKKFLPVLDDFKNMIEKTQTGDNNQSVLDGVKLIYEKFQQILEREGMQKIEALGQDFDPEFHEALMLKPIEDESQHNKVVEVFQEGFMLKDRLLKPSKVVVGKYEEK